MLARMYEPPQFLTITEAAEITGRSHWCIRRWQKIGLLTRFKVGVRTAVSRMELEALVNARRGKQQQ